MLIINMHEKTSDQWLKENPVLPRGLGGFETDTKRFKVGDGKTPWANLSYRGRPTPRLLGPLAD